MKTINVMTVLLATLLMAGCSQNEVMEVSPDTHPQMTFGGYTRTSTRGLDMDNNRSRKIPTQPINMVVSVSWVILRVIKHGTRQRPQLHPALCTIKK